MSRAKRTQIKAKKEKEKSNVSQYETKITFDEDVTSEKAVIITALLKQAEETEDITLTIANKGISLIRFPKETLLTIFEIVLPNAMPESEDVKILSKRFVEVINESNTVIFQLHK
ncbi:MAG: hypothetical protein M3367_02925 [Acidobacteriota bacterium]|nr:hypothetical protein [Acidobacteriota bacterium]